MSLLGLDDMQLFVEGLGGRGQARDFVLGGLGGQQHGLGLGPGSTFVADVGEFDERAVCAERSYADREHAVRDDLVLIGDVAAAELGRQLDAVLGLIGRQRELLAVVGLDDREAL